MSAAALLLAVAVLLSRSSPVIRRRRTRRFGCRAETATRSDPFATASALDVFAVCLSAGMAVPAAAAATAQTAPSALSAVLHRAAGLLMLGADADDAWQVADDADECAAALARLARRSSASGSALAAGVAQLAEQSRQDAAHTAMAAAERAGVLIAGPLGLCFLPAFVLLGIVPVVAGLAEQMFGGGLL